MVFSCETSKRKTVLSRAVRCDIVKQFSEQMPLMPQDVRVNGGSFYEISGTGQVRITFHKTRFTRSNIEKDD